MTDLEKVAAAIRTSDPNNCDESMFTDIARAALKALLPPSEAMVEEGAVAIRDFEQRHRRHPGDIAVDDMHRHKANRAIEAMLGAILKDSE